MVIISKVNVIILGLNKIRHQLYEISKREKKQTHSFLFADDLLLVVKIQRDRKYLSKIESQPK